MNSSSKLSSLASGDGSESSLEQSSEASAVSVSSSRVAAAALDLLNLLRDATSQDVEAQVLAAFLLIAKRGPSDPPNILEVAKIADIGEASASRIVAMLGRGLRGKPGAGLLETREDPTNYSRKLVHLSAKGQRLMQRMGESMVGSLSKWGRE